VRPRGFQQWLGSNHHPSEPGCTVHARQRDSPLLPLAHLLLAGGLPPLDSLFVDGGSAVVGSTRWWHVCAAAPRRLRAVLVDVVVCMSMCGRVAATS
jgi:hypothetical protein